MVSHTKFTFSISQFTFFMWKQRLQGYYVEVVVWAFEIRPRFQLSIKYIKYNKSGACNQRDHGSYICAYTSRNIDTIFMYWQNSVFSIFISCNLYSYLNVPRKICYNFHKHKILRFTPRYYHASLYRTQEDNWPSLYTLKIHIKDSLTSFNSISACICKLYQHFLVTMTICIYIGNITYTE